jgi:hypothetical protein
MEPKTIDDVLLALDGIVETCRRRGDANAYFAALYRRVTAEVKRRIEAGVFEDGPRMARFDVVFAQRYLDAWAVQERGGRPTEAWAAAFAAAARWRPVVLQHLLLGMNAHINLDLGIAAAQIAPGAAIGGLKRDFEAINQVLADQVDDVQDRMAKIWPALRWLDRAGGRLDEAVVNFSIRRARSHAWAVAARLAALTGEVERVAYIREVDTAMNALAGRVVSPGLKISAALLWVRLRERGTLAEKLDALRV